MISIDYAFMKDEDGEGKEEMGRPILVLKDRSKKWMSANMVKKKGKDPFAIKVVLRDIENILRNNRLF